jgi:Nop14-like family
MVIVTICWLTDMTTLYSYLTYMHTAGTAAADDSDGEELSAEKEAELERKATKRAQTRQAAAREMPYVMPCPQSMEELLELLAKHAASAADANTVVSPTCIQQRPFV